MSFDGTPSEHVITEIARRESVEPSQLETTLYDVIDPEALDSIFQHGTTREESTDITIKFSYYGYEVIVESPGHVVVQPPSKEQATENGISQGSTVD